MFQCVPGICEEGTSEDEISMLRRENSRYAVFNISNFASRIPMQKLHKYGFVVIRSWKILSLRYGQRIRIRVRLVKTKISYITISFSLKLDLSIMIGFS